MMKSFFALVVLAFAVAYTSAFGGYTPVFASSPSVSLKNFSYNDGELPPALRHGRPRERASCVRTEPGDEIRALLISLSSFCLFDRGRNSEMEQLPWK